MNTEICKKEKVDWRKRKGLKKEEKKYTDEN